MSATETPPAAETDDALFQRLSAEMVGSFYTLVKVALVHKMDNKAVIPIVERFVAALSAYQEEYGDQVALQLVGEAVYINRRLLRTDLSTWDRARFLRSFFGRIGMAEVAFDQVMDPAIMREFAQSLRDVVMNNESDAEKRLSSHAGIRMRAIDAEAGAAGTVGQVPDRLRVLRAYGLVVATLRDLLTRLGEGRPAPLVPIRRSMQELVRLPDRTRSLQLGLLSLEQYRDELSGRLARVALIVALMAERLGFRAADRRDMAVAAALSGVGRMRHPKLLTATPEQCARHDVYLDGVRRLLPSSGRGRATALRILAAVEQASAEGRRAGHPLTRMIAVADTYDLWTTRAPLGPGLRPDAALNKLVESSELDHAVARLLIATLGLFPVGSSVRLSSGETAIVMDITDDPRHVTRPRVMVVADANGMPTEHRMIDLAEVGLEILGTVDAAEIDLNVGHFLFA
ncbi:MAG: hypothetical protein GXP55_04715 [Deltaproteobacteria bacterium]|nr:hypothetical protein [Deltaproteobacteria bacterium]